MQAGLEIYLRLGLLRASYSQVAEEGGVPVGLILGRIKTDYRLIRNMRHLPALLGAGLKFLLFFPRGKLLFQQAVREHQAYDQLMHAAQGSFDGEVVLFIVSEEMRGRGVGKKLITDFLELCRRRGLNRIYLYSDTSCNYGFYDRMGFQRIGEKKIRDENLETGQDFTVFLYEYQF